MGSEKLLEVLDPGIIGGLVLPLLGLKNWKIEN